MKTEKNNDELDEPKYFPRVNRVLKKLDKFWNDVIAPNDLEEVAAVAFVIVMFIIVISVIAFFLPIGIKLISLWWNLIL